MRRFLFIIITICISIPGFSQFQNVMISDEQSPNEPSITMNPRNPNELVAGANLRSYYYSIDGGWNWTRGDLTSPEYGVWGDPCIITDTAGQFYFFHLSNPNNGTWIDRIVCQKFDIDNTEWTEGSYMGLNGTKKQDKEWAVVDSSTNAIYVTWTQFDQYGTSDPDKYSNIMFSKSINAGETWTNAKQINEVSGDCVDSDNTTEGAVPAVGPNGEVYVAWSGPEGIVFDRSFDAGETWLDDDIFVSEQGGGWDYDIPGISRCNGLPITCCDLSNSAYNGTIYVNWTDQRNGLNDTDVWISSSTDKGNTWTVPKRVNDDEPGKHQFFSWMTIDQANGDIYIVFYDRRNYTNNNTDVYLARSTDGGVTFENMLISEEPFLPYNTVFFGDYTNITAHNGQVRPIWARLQGGKMSIWTAIIDITTGITAVNDALPFSLEQNFPNPFRQTTYFSFKIKEASTVNLSVYDIYGRLITTMIDDQHRSVGKYVEKFDAYQHQLPSGVYWYILRSGNKVQKRKMLLIE